MYDRDDADERADEDTRDARERTAQPRTDNGDDVEHAGDKAKCSSTGQAHDRKTDAAPNSDDAALDERCFDVAPYHARERDLENNKIFAMILAEQAIDLFIERRQFEQDPERDDERETHDQQRIGDT